MVILKISLILWNVITLGIFYTPSMDYLDKKIKSSEDIEWFFTYCKYISDETLLEEFKTPEEFHDDRGGDCEDFAVFVYEKLIKLNYDCRIYGMYREDEDIGHAIVTYNNNDNDKGYFSNTNRIIGETNIDTIINNNKYDSYRLYNWKARRKYMRIQHSKKK